MFIISHLDLSLFLPLCIHHIIIVTKKLEEQWTNTHGQILQGFCQPVASHLARQNYNKRLEWQSFYTSASYHL